MKSISSRDNPAFKHWKKLAQSGRERKKAGQTLLEGMHLLTAWQARHGIPKQVLVSERGLKQAEIAAWLAQQDGSEVETVQLPDALFHELADTETPAGILALVDLPSPETQPCSDKDSLVLDGIQDPGNMGTLLRTAAAAGFTQVVLSTDCVSPWSPKVLRAGQGAHFLLDIYEGVELPGFLQNFSGTSLATALEQAEDLYRANWQGPVAWVFGAEGQGVSAPVLAAARQRIRIPMPGAVESLNVGAAAAICLFETVRRRS